MEPLKILHVLGSPTDYFSYNVSVWYGGSFSPDMGGGKYSFTYAIVRPNGSWSFSDDLSGVPMIESPEQIERDMDDDSMEITAALQHIKFVIKPDLALVHFECYKGLTAYRSLFDALDIALIGGSTESRYLAMDKLKTRTNLLGNKKVPCAEGFVYKKGDALRLEEITFPCVVKASRGEDSKAVRLARDQKSFLEAIDHALTYSDRVIVERFIQGREIRSAVVESVKSGELIPLSCLEYKVPHDDIRSTEYKLAINEKGLPLGKPSRAESWFLDPTKEEDLVNRIHKYSCQAFVDMDVKDFGMFDFRVDRHGNPYLLECNLFCSFGKRSILNILAKDSNFTDEGLFDLMVENALLRRNNNNN